MEDKNIQRFCGMLGFAMRAGRLILGSELVCRALPSGKVKLVVVAENASGGTKKKIFNKCKFYGTEVFEGKIETERLGKILGKTHPISSVAVTDAGFAKEIKTSITGE